MVNEPGLRRARRPRHAQRAQRQFVFDGVPHRPPHTATRSQIEHGRQVQRTFARRDVRNVGDPDAVEADPIHVELTVQQVWRDRIGVIRIRRGHASPFGWARREPVLPHEPRNTLGTGRQPLRLQRLMHARRTVGLTTLIVMIRTRAMSISSMSACQLGERFRDA